MKQGFLQTLLGSYLSVAVISLIGFFTAPLALHYFGKDLYGIFAITSDTLAYLGLFSFGIPWAAATIFAKVTNNKEQKIVIIRSLNLLFLISILLTVLLLLINVLFPHWINLIGGVSFKKIETVARQFIVISVVFFLLRLPLSLFNQLLIFSNQVLIAKIIDVFSTICVFSALIFTIKLNLSLIAYAYIIGIVSLVVIGCNAFAFYKTWQQGKVESITVVAEKSNVTTYKYIFKSGYFFFINGIGGLLIWNSDSLIISHYLGLGDVAEYAILFKIFMLLLMAITQIINIINPLYPKYYRENKLSKLKVIYNLENNIFPIIGGVLFIFMFGFFKEFIRLWLHTNNMFPGYLSVFIMGLYLYILIISVVSYHAMASLNHAKYLYKLTLCEAVINLLLTITLIRYLGLAGVILGTCIAHFVIMFIFSPLQLQKVTHGLFVANFKVSIKHFTVIMLPVIGVIYYLNSYDHMNIILKAFYLIVIGLVYLILSLVLLSPEVKHNILSIDKLKAYVNGSE